MREAIPRGIVHNRFPGAEGKMDEAMEAAGECNFPFKLFVTPAVLGILDENSANFKAKRKDLFYQIYSVLNIAISQRKEPEGETILFAVPIDDSEGRKQSLKLEGWIGCTPLGHPAITVKMLGGKSGLSRAQEQTGSLEDCLCFKNRCKYYGGMKGAKGETGWIHKCNAFPGGIPLDIWRGKRSHSSPLPNQENRIKFQRVNTFGQMEMFRGKRNSL